MKHWMALTAFSCLTAGTITIPNNGETGSFQEGSGGLTRTRTIGQTFGVPTPVSENILNEIRFFLPNVPASFDYHVAIYQWNGTATTGSVIYDSGAQEQVAGTNVVIALTGLNVTLDPMNQYIAFLSTQGNGAQFGDEFVNITLSRNTSDPYSGGAYYFQQSASTTPTWTSDPWTEVSGSDLEFEIILSMTPVDLQSFSVE